MLNENNSERNNYFNNLNNRKESVFNFCLFNKKKQLINDLFLKTIKIVYERLILITHSKRD